MEARISVLILAGGASSRMRYPKAFIKLGDLTLIDHIISVYKRFTDNIFITLNYEFTINQWYKDYEELNKKATVIINEKPELGRFYSIKLGLKEISNSDFCFVHNVDNPVKWETLDKLLQQKNENGYTIPAFEGKNGHPILISRRIIAVATAEINDNINWKAYLSAYKRNIADISDDSILVNLNTPEDFENYKKLNG